MTYVPTFISLVGYSDEDLFFIERGSQFIISNDLSYTEIVDDNALGLLLLGKLVTIFEREHELTSSVLDVQLSVFGMSLRSSILAGLTVKDLVSRLLLDDPDKLRLIRELGEGCRLEVFLHLCRNYFMDPSNSLDLESVLALSVSHPQLLNVIRYGYPRNLFSYSYEQLMIWLLICRRSYFTEAGLVHSTDYVKQYLLNLGLDRDVVEGALMVAAYESFFTEDLSYFSKVYLTSLKYGGFTSRTQYVLDKINPETQEEFDACFALGLAPEVSNDLMPMSYLAYLSKGAFLRFDLEVMCCYVLGANGSQAWGLIKMVINHLYEEVSTTDHLVSNSSNLKDYYSPRKSVDYIYKTWLEVVYEIHLLVRPALTFLSWLEEGKRLVREKSAGIKIAILFHLMILGKDENLLPYQHQPELACPYYSMFEDPNYYEVMDFCYHWVMVSEMGLDGGRCSLPKLYLAILRSEFFTYEVVLRLIHSNSFLKPVSETQAVPVPSPSQPSFIGEMTSIGSVDHGLVSSSGPRLTAAEANFRMLYEGAGAQIVHPGTHPPVNRPRRRGSLTSLYEALRHEVVDSSRNYSGDSIRDSINEFNRTYLYNLAEHEHQPSAADIDVGPELRGFGPLLTEEFTVITVQDSGDNP